MLEPEFKTAKVEVMKTESGVQKRKVDHSCTTSPILTPEICRTSLGKEHKEFEPLLLSENLKSLHSSAEEWKSRNTVIDAEPKLDEVECLFNQVQQVNLYQDEDLNRKWAALQDSALLVHLHGEKVRNSAPVIFFAELSHRNLVKLLAYCWEDKWLLHPCLFVKKDSIYTASNCKLACSIKDVKMQSGRRVQLQTKFHLPD